ncbi:gliding motility-associated C-terminal domain-containing protein [Chitinophaga sp. CF118]|uniref:PKD domain-containing protein n=1 Tax=Chitinophaga sp. CF118 TaxID=1884367 RepID=UPI0008E8CB7C|nr:PKD domain-containing protein [Chitinophaga sp. CF118]SFD11266.1 gliding motility-associated C-terminal domain-containing protein [Chitinophaga sp. CF118]
MKHQHLRRHLLTGYTMLFLFAILLFTSAKAQAQNVAEFTADNWTGCGTAYVQFINQSTPVGGSASWDFGDGGTKSTIWNATRAFNKPGVYVVTLTVTFPDGKTASVKHTVNVYNKPNVKFTTTPVDGCTPLNVTFTDQSTAGDGTISSINWDFGDGNGATGSTATYTYNQGMDIIASSIVTNSFGCTNSADQIIKVKATPQVAFTSSNQGGCKSPVSVNFTNNTSLNTTSSVPVTYEWDFGDGSTSTDMNPTHVYTTKGSFTVTLKATTADGCTQTLVQPNYILVATMQADFSIVEKPCSGINLHFTNTTKPDPVSATWTFSDGSTQNTVDAVKTFAAAGDYDVTMNSITVDGCDATVTKTVHITDPPQASFTILPATACSVPVNATFTATTTGATAWQWDFADGGTATTQNPAHQYTTEGAFNVTLAATSAEGCVATVNNTINIKRPILSISGPTAGCIPVTATYTPSIGSADPVVKYDWNFGDGGTSTVQIPTHTFTVEGNYVVSLTITTQGGCTQTATLPVRVGTPVVVDFTVDKTSGCQPTLFSFTNKSVPAGQEWFWTFEENNGSIGSSSLENPTYVFNSIGKHDVTLVVNNNGCVRQLTKPDYIEIFPPAASFNVAQPDCGNIFQRIFVDASDFGTGTTKIYTWDFGDGTPTSDVPSPTHTYAAAGLYTVILTVDNGSCTSKWSTTVNIITDKPVITPDQTVVCRGTAVNFTMNPVQAGNYINFQWDWGDGSTTPAPANSPVSHTYLAPGVYQVKLTLTDIYMCQHISDPITITVNGSIAGYTINPRQCKDEPISFTDISTTRAGNTIVSWTWDFGDNTAPLTSTTKPVNVTHTYSAISNYPVTLTVKDNTGCTDTYTDIVHIANIVASFGANDSIACLNLPFKFNNSSTEDPLTYAWTFGDGGTSTDKEPLHTYTTPGVYNITLDIVGSTGCTSHAEIKNFLRVPNPIADFTVPSVAADVCPPVKIQLTNNSSDYVRSVWSLGDGSTSTENDPLHNYIRPGTFPVSLTVYSAGNCASAPAGPKNITIAGPDGTFSVTPETGCSPLSITMTAVSSNAKKYIWDFGNGYSVTTTTPTSPAYTYPQEGVYFPVVLLEDDRGCKVAALGNPKVVSDKIHADFSTDLTQACDGGTVFFTDKTTGISTEMGLTPTFAWDFGITTRTDDVGSGATPTFDYTTPGTYTVKLTSTSVYGCVDDTTMDILIEPRPVAVITPVNPICAGTSVQLQGQDTKNLPNTKWVWTVAGKDYNVVTPPAITFNNAGSQPVQLVITTASGNCSGTDNKTIEVSGFPALQPSPASASICLGDAIQILANTDPGVQINWTDYKISDPQSAAPTVSPEIDTVYHVVVENTVGCKTEADVPVKVSQPFQITVSDVEMCVGKTVQLQASGAVHYSWSPTTGLNNPTSATPIASPEVTTTYQVTGTGNDNCFTDVKDVLVTVHTLPTVNAGEDVVLPVGSSIQIPATISSDVTKLEWFPPSGLTCIDCLTPTATPKQTTDYILTATNQYGCISTDEINIKMVCESGVVFLPNTFTPNGDGQNDIFYIRGKGINTVKSFRIYNRWGQLIFERSNFNIEDAAYGWDGKAKGALVDPDVFVYVAELVCNTNESFTLKGNVMLLR